MTRREAREQAFMLIFERTFRDESIETIVAEAEEGRDLQVAPFALELAKMTVERLEELDQIIENNLKNWKKGRLSRVVLAILRLSTCEMLYNKEIPVSVSINEAIEITKKFATQEDANFVNGILGSVADSMEESKGKPTDETKE